MTTTDRRAFTSKKELAAWLASNGIQLAKPLTLKQGSFSFTPVLPPSAGSRGYTMTFKLLGSEPPLHTYRPEKAGGVPMTPEECANEDVRVERMNEIQALLFRSTRNVYMHTH
jgi:hypothetical protein